MANPKHDEKVLVKHIDAFGKGLSEWEIKFIKDMIDRPPVVYSPAQTQTIYRIYDNKC